MKWNVIDEFDRGKFNISLNENVDDDECYSISIASEADEVWMLIDNEYSAIQIFDLLLGHCFLTNDGP